MHLIGDNMSLLTLEEMKNMSIDDIVRLYQSGYILENCSLENDLSIHTLQWAIEISCTYDRQVFVGGTITGNWGYVWKFSDYSEEFSTAYVILLKDGVGVDSKVMSTGDSFTVSNPANIGQKQSIIVTSIQIGRETKVLFVDYCEWTQQNAILTEVSIPSLETDGQSYTMIGTLSANITGNPIVGEKVYITENGIRIKETTTGTATDPNPGLFSLTFTYYAGNNYSISYPGTISVNGIERILTASPPPPGATHILEYSYPTPIPDSIAAMFNAITPADLITKTTSLLNEYYPDVGWNILDIQIETDKILIYVQKTYTLTGTHTNSPTGKITSLFLDEVAFLSIAIGIIAMAIGILTGAVLTGPLFWGAIAVLFGFLLLGRRKIWEILAGGINQILADLGLAKPTTKEVNDNMKEFLQKKLQECTDTYNASGKTSTDCKTYAECMRDVYANFQEFTQSYLFGKVATELTQNANKVKTDIDTKCIQRFDLGEITCTDMIACAQSEGSASIAGGDTIIYSAYPENSPFTPPWEQPGGPGGILGGLLGGLLMIGAVTVGGYLIYKFVTRPKPTVVEVKPEIIREIKK